MKKLLAITLFFGFIFSSAQELCTYQAAVMDSLQIPAYDASVTAFDIENNNVGFTFTDIEGRFELKMPCGKNYELEIEHLEFEPKVVQVNLDKSKTEKITLQRSSIALKDVVAKGRVPIKVKGDTIEYDADSFKTGNEETLEDILKKLPGIEVKEGKVFFQGKQINSVKVEGREIFGGNTKLLTKNLPSDAVDKIQLNQKYKANPFANSMQDEEQPELNIVLKEDKKNLIFGNITVGGDADEHYDLQEKLFRFSKKTDATLISDFNTFGKSVFDSEDYFQFLGGMSEFMEEGGSSALRNSMSSIFFNTGQDATEMSNHLGAFHVGYEPKPKLNITAFALATDNSVRYNSTTERIYSDFTQTDESENENNIFSFISRLKLDYTVNNKSNIKYRVNFNQQNQDDHSKIESFLNDESTPMLFRTNDFDRKNSALNQRLSYITKVGKDDNFGLYFTHLYQNEKPNSYLISTEEPFSGFFDFDEINGEYQLNQIQKLKVNTLQGLAVYNHLITNLSNIRIKLGANISNQSLENNIFHGSSLIDNEFTPTNNDFDYFEYYVDATYTRKINKFKFDIGTGLHRFNTKSDGTQSNYERNITRLQPHFRAEYKINSGSGFNLNYNQTFELPQIRQLNTGYDINNYFSIFQGNNSLRETRFHQAGLNYYLYNYFKFFTFYAGVTYSKRLDNVRNSGYFDELIQYYTLFNSKTPEDNWGANMYVSKRFAKFYTLSGNGSANWYSFGSRTQGQDIVTDSDSYFLKINNNFKIKNKLELDAGLSWTKSVYNNEFNQNDFVNWQPFAKLAYHVSEPLLLQLNYEFNDQYNNGENINSNHDLGGSIRFQPAKKVYLYLTVGNLLNNDQLVSNSFNDFYTSVYTRNILGRYFIGSVRMKF